MELITSNFGRVIRRGVLQGREHLIVPVSMIVPGVLNGSQGPLLYPADEVARDPESWNGIPLVVYHPTRNGSPISARSPDVLEAQGIGAIFNARINQRGRLIAEGWFDVEKTQRVDARILPMLEAGAPIELSTGLFTDNEPAEGTHNGKVYRYIARNYRPDHLAILPDMQGACSVRDGCGVNVNERNLMERFITTLPANFHNQDSEMDRPEFDYKAHVANHTGRPHACTCSERSSTANDCRSEDDDMDYKPFDYAQHVASHRRS